MAWHFHAVPNDYYRFTKSGLKYIFRNFEKTYIHPCRGYVASLFQLSLVPFKGSKFLTGVPISLLNRLASYLDSKFYDDRLTTNFVVVAEK